MTGGTPERGEGGRFYAAARPLLMSLPPGLAHSLALSALGPFEVSAALRTALRRAVGAVEDDRLALRRVGLRFPSPIGLAAGFDKNARRPRALAALGFGHLELGTVTARPQAENPRPNLFRLPKDRALVNRLGFPNEGARQVASRLRRARAAVGVPVGISIGKSRVVPADAVDAVVADYLESFDAVRDAADFVVVNVSSPNTPGLRSLQTREHAQRLLGTLRDRAGADGRLLVKLAPDLEERELDDVLAVVESVGLDGVVASNTTLSREGLRTDPEAVRAMGGGGLSGPPLRARAVARVRAVRDRLGPQRLIIGVGGVERAEHAIDLIRAGADLVQMYTGLIYEGPGAPARIARAMRTELDRAGAPSIDALRGR